jgi:hypothetical protein
MQTRRVKTEEEEKDKTLPRPNAILYLLNRNCSDEV